MPISAGLPNAELARASVENALTLDRVSTRLVQRTDARLLAARADFDAANSSDLSVVLTATNALQVAFGASLFATNYQMSCQTLLATSLDALSGSGIALQAPAASGDPQSAPTAAAVVLAEATAIAAGSETRLAGETYVRTVRAASVASNAVQEAAANVAHAAEDEQRARALADTLAAAEVAGAEVAGAPAPDDVANRAEHADPRVAPRTA